jgi:hypothetical protein
MNSNNLKKVFLACKTYVLKRRILAVVLIVFLLIAGAYGYGYRVGPGVQLNRVGSLTLTNLPKGTLVYADQVLNTTTTKDGDVRIELVKGSHDIIIAAPNDYPWNNRLSLASGVNTVANPILVATKPNALALTGDDKTAAFAAVAATTQPIRIHPLKLAGGCAVVYVENNRILADATTSPGCTPPPYLCTGAGCASTIIFAPVAPLGAVFPFPGRQDALVFQLGHVLYAISLDPRNPQFFAPILTGVNPLTGSLPDGTIVVRNDAVAYKLKL